MVDQPGANPSAGPQADTAHCDAEPSGALGWPRPLYQRRWFAWRPVRIEGGGWAWLRTVTKTRLTYKAGDWLFEGSVYALLP
jgi:hypothetical protein